MSFTKREALAVITSRMLRDGISIFVGIGISQLATELAKRLGKKNINIIYEGGTIDPVLKPPYIPYSTNDIRVGFRALMYPTCLESFTFMQRGLVDLALLGAAQVDRYGNVNSSLIRTEKGNLYLPGSGGANDLASLARETMIITALEKRRFVERVDFITSPGHLSGGESRKKEGLVGNGPSKVITDLAIFSFENGEMKVDGILHGCTIEEVLGNMSFHPKISKEIYEIPEPTEEELTILRSLDPNRVFLG